VAQANGDVATGGIVSGEQGLHSVRAHLIY